MWKTLELWKLSKQLSLKKYEVSQNQKKFFRDKSVQHIWEKLYFPREIAQQGNSLVSVFKELLLVFTKVWFWRGDWTLGYLSMKIRIFADIFWFPKILTLFRMGIFGASNGWEGGKNPPLSNICHTYPKMTKHGTVIPDLKMIKKNNWIMWHVPWFLLTSALFYRKSTNFVISRNTGIDCILVHNF